MNPTSVILSVKPALLQPFLGLIAAQSTRHGGVSPEPFASLNLGLSSGDEAANVHENRRRFFADLGIRPEEIALGFQVHGDNVCVVEKPGVYDEYDAFVTNQPNVFVAVSVADCTPVLIYDPATQAVAAVHAGWKGTMNRIVAKTLLQMTRHFGTRPTDCLAYIGACISECAFEVDADVADHFDGRFKRFDEERNKFLVDLKQANLAQLLDSGVPEKQIEVSPYCTVAQNDTFFSYRKEGKRSGRMLAVIGTMGGAQAF